MAEKIYRVLGSGEESGFCIDDGFLEAVENALSMGHGAWDTIDPKEICAVVVADNVAVSI